MLLEGLPIEVEEPADLQIGAVDQCHGFARETCLSSSVSGGIEFDNATESSAAARGADESQSDIGLNSGTRARQARSGAAGGQRCGVDKRCGVARTADLCSGESPVVRFD